MKAKNNVLSRIQTIRFANWMQENKKKHGTLTMKKIAEIASNELGFTLTDRNIEGMERTLGFRMNRVGPILMRPASINGAMDGVLERLSRIEHILRANKLFSEIGLNVITENDNGAK